MSTFSLFFPFSKISAILSAENSVLLKLFCDISKEKKLGENNSFFLNEEKLFLNRPVSAKIKS